jgi:hypothetical protein
MCRIRAARLQKRRRLHAALPACCYIYVSHTFVPVKQVNVSADSTLLYICVEYCCVSLYPAIYAFWHAPGYKLTNKLICVLRHAHWGTPLLHYLINEPTVVLRHAHWGTPYYIT